MVVAIDGPAGVGKSSIAQMIAKTCNFYYLNSGSFYRAYTYLHVQEGRDPMNYPSVLETAKQYVLSIEDGHICVNGSDIEDKLHTPEVDAVVAQVSSYPPLRNYVNEQLRRISKDMNVVVEGRDITTVVFPDADLKCYFDAKPEVRAERRLQQHPDGQDYATVLRQIKMRDEIDKGKEVGALRVAEDALYIDTSYLTIGQVCEKVLSAIFTLKGDVNR
ncbi:(d)CMP kinase [Sphaerochaeta halotolerans]|jgi:cytidylate kinase|uniref:Cytidylate kinase n=1 Tax=Sphaerochaeta halotolerans TaxID=2293840 RepID=A0A372MFR7_9SPIR|nr:(d)CMP kinase [Sphaerochaeta halotolerans]MBG0766213.1 (d)CMP kinase [Spirochaetaceae bacterium]MDK2860258.1 CMP/dCMP kinase [Sphaerochaeta sp.]MDN5334822.1 CMP/dCMP kinase [Sphaerochaeta sp.]MXI86205.1 (d)CMP kinase [Sphaerochaeta halotolerans]RFU94627.1 (d)CMP kinase [Sphaerochaeta halotolerans]